MEVIIAMTLLGIISASYLSISLAVEQRQERRERKMDFYLTAQEISQEIVHNLAAPEGDKLLSLLRQELKLAQLLETNNISGDNHPEYIKNWTITSAEDISFLIDIYVFTITDSDNNSLYFTFIERGGLLGGLGGVKK
ncbi:hypothetical protein SAMN04488692_104131 [Halarsenatibacter silvermanii]|uniref:Uncharacterized protein n=2 Tax=Halarsenatibacter silvermanii TaxID=321763 RepID=A0A1G9K066_9FIRM|nr:hypothetical protein SAMN04488692_104131 [Halarsenatibacter silvermanii]